MTMKPFKSFITEKTYYRGHPKGVNPNKPNKKGITWVTPSKELAATYGDEVSEVDYNLRGKKLVIPEMNTDGNIFDLLRSVEKWPRNKKQQELWDEAVEHFGVGYKRLSLDKFLHKVGSEKVIAFLKSMKIKVIEAKEDGILTFGIIK